jgi:glyoxylase-like metal-dependent hydrolase (beta-lactamase superfamily II)
MKITDTVYALDATKGNYAYLILGKETMLIDTGLPWQRKKLLRELETMHIRPEDIRHICLTHHDIDHVGNAAYLQQATGATLWASQEDIPYIKGDLPRHGQKKYYAMIFQLQKPQQINAYPSDLRLGEIEIIPTPGHTPGHVCLRYQDVLFAGDLVASSKGHLKHMPRFSTWDTTALHASLRKIAAIPFTWICLAHGQPLERGNQWQQLYDVRG